MDLDHFGISTPKKITNKPIKKTTEKPLTTIRVNDLDVISGKPYQTERCLYCRATECDKNCENCKWFTDCNNFTCSFPKRIFDKRQKSNFK